MEQIDVSKLVNMSKQVLQSCSVLIGLLLLGGMPLSAQVNWEAAYPKWSAGSEVLTVEGDEGLLEVYLTTSQDITNAALEFALPPNTQYTGMENATAYTISTTGTIATGQKVTAKLKTGTLAAYSSVQVKLKLKALCGIQAGAGISVQVLSGADMVSGSQKTVTIQSQTPAIQMLAISNKVDYSAANEYQSLGYKLTATNGKANTFKVVLTVDEYTTLKNFKFDGKSVSEVVSANKLTYTLTLSDLSSLEKELTFEGTSNRIGSHLITPSVQYPSNKNCTTTAGQVITMAFPNVSGVPVMEYVNGGYLTADGQTEIMASDIKLDGVTPFIAWVEYINSSKYTGMDMTYTLTLSYYSYWDVNTFYYQLNGGEKIPIPESCIKSHTLCVSNRYINYTSETEGKPRIIIVTLPGIVKLEAQQKIKIGGAFISGDIYDNEDKIALGGGTMKSCDITSTIRNEAGESSSPLSKGIPGGHGFPSTSVFPAEFFIKPGESIIQTLPMNTAYDLTYQVKRKIYIQLPSWLKLDDSDGKDPFVWESLNGTVYTPVESVNGTSTSYRIYEKMPYDASAFFTFKYTTDGTFDPTEANKEGEIVYWVDIEVNGRLLEKVCRVVQPVTLQSKKEGVSLNDFDLFRITRGLIDSDEDYFPDSNDPALDKEINHSIYLVGDKGEFRWNLQTEEASSYLYLPVTNANLLFNGATQHLNLKKDEISIKVNNQISSLPVDLICSNDNKGFYLLVNSPSSFNAGQKIDIRLPFEAVKSLISTMLTTECFVSDSKIADPFNSANNPDRKGLDQKSQNIIIGQPSFYYGAWDGNFDDMSNEELTIGSYITVGPGNVPRPYFVKETRRLGYASLLTLEIPDGYELKDGYKIVAKRDSQDKEGVLTQDLYPVSIVGNTYTYDFSTLYDLDYLNKDDLVRDLTKWVPGVNYWTQSYTCKIRVSKGAAIGANTGKATMVFKNLSSGEEETVSRTGTFTYNGTATQLNNIPVSLPVYGSALEIPVATIANPNDFELEHLWLYVGGNISDVKFNSASSAHGRWLNVGSLASTANQSYGITFNYLGRPDGLNMNDTVTVYTVSDFGDPSFPSDPTQYAIDSDELKDYLGARKKIILIPGATKIGGSLTANAQLNYGSPYTVTAVIDGTSSSGILRNPQISITIPSGQDYVANSLHLDFAGTTSYDLSALETLLLDGNGTGQDGPAAERTVTLSLKEAVEAENAIMPGNLSSDPADTNDKRIATFTLQFQSMCNTDLKGIRYKGEIGSENVTGSLPRLSQLLLPATTAKYTFEASASIEGGNRAFNESSKDRTLKVIIKKASGANETVNAGDYLQLEMPDVMNINGSTVEISSTNISGVTGASVIENKPGSGKRTIKLPVPVTAINADGNGGFAKEIEYEIPIKYTAPLNGTATDIIAVNYISAATFGPCQEKDASLGGDDVKIAILTATENPYRVTVGESVILDISTPDFGGKWYTDVNLTNELSSLTITPTVSGDVTYYVSAIVDGTDYGSVPVTVKAYPSLDYTIKATSVTECGELDYTFDTGLLSDTKPGVTYTFYSSDDANPDGSLKDANKVTGQIKIGNNSTYWVQAYNQYEYSDPQRIVFTINIPVNAAIAFKGKSTTSETIITPNSIILKASGAALSGTKGTWYQFYKNGVELGTPQTSDEYTITASSSNVGTSNYTVAVVNQDGGQDNLCGTSLVSLPVSITVIDEPDKVELPGTYDVGKICEPAKSIVLYDLITNKSAYESAITFEYNTDGGATRVALGKSDRISVPVGTTTYYIWAKRGTTPSPVAGTVSITVSQYTAIDLGTVTVSPVEDIAGSTVSATITITGTSGDKDAGGNYTYNVYTNDSDLAALDTKTEAGDGTSFALSLAVPSLSEATLTGYKEYIYYVSAQGACGESARQEVKVKVYPKAEITATTSEEKFCTTDATLTITKLLSYVSGNLKSDWFDYTYSITGSANVTDAALTDAILLPTTAGTYDYTLKATNKRSGSVAATATLRIQIIAPILFNKISSPIHIEEGGSGIITASLSAGTANEYELYRINETIADETNNTSGSFTIAYSAPDAGQAYKSVTYYIKALGETDCAHGTSNNVEVRMYPAPALTAASSATDSFCETDSRLGVSGTGINLWDYMQEIPNPNWFTYTYGINKEPQTEIPADGFVKLDDATGNYELKLKAVNKLEASSSLPPATLNYILTVAGKTSINSIRGYSVTEGEAINIVVAATGEDLMYTFYEGSSVMPLQNGPSNTYHITSSATVSANNGKVYRVEVTGNSICDKAVSNFTLDVKSGGTDPVPPVGNNKVSWTVIGYGQVEVTADGIPISNNSHVNNGAVLRITASTWLSNLFDWITINGTKYTSSPVSYTVNGENIEIEANFLGSDPNPDPNSNADIESSTLIWTEGGYACIYTETASRIRIVTFNGRLVTDQKVGEGESRIQLPDGYYIVTLSDGTTKKIAVRN